MSEKEFNKLLDQCVGCARVNSKADFCPNCPGCHKEKSRRKNSHKKQQQKNNTSPKKDEIPFYRNFKPVCRSKKHFSR